MAHPLLERRNRVPRADGVVGEAERRRQRRELRRGDLAQPGERRVGAEAGAERGDRGGAADEALGEQAARGVEGAGHEPDPAPQPAHSAGRFRTPRAKRGRGRGHACGVLGGRHGVLDIGERARQPCRQTVRQQAERGVALGTVPARDPRAGGRLAGVGAVPRERTAAARVVRTTRQGCMTPALGLNVLLAGKPRPETKLHPAAARRSPVRAGRPPLLLRWRQLTGIGQVQGAPARTRSALAPLRWRFERLFNASDAYLRDTPP